MDLTKIPLIFNVYKPVGMSSFDVVSYFKKNLNFNFGKIGHFGTLDPFAEGVLLIGIQGSQKINNYLHELLPKTYRAVGVFGGKTMTGDLTSPILTTLHLSDEIKNKSKEELEIFFQKKFIGEYWQGPHAVSAAKFEGKRLYQYALAGTIIEKEKVKREIYSLSIHRYEYPYLEFSATVSSGTYIRSLFEEMAEELSGVGALASLVRLAVGDIKIENSILKENWPLKNAIYSLEHYALSVDQVLVFDHLILDGDKAKLYLQGRHLHLNDFQVQINTQPICSDKYFWVYHQEGVLLGMATVKNSMIETIFNLNLSIARYLNNLMPLK